MSEGPAGPDRPAASSSPSYSIPSALTVLRISPPPPSSGRGRGSLLLWEPVLVFLDFGAAIGMPAHLSKGDAVSVRVNLGERGYDIVVTSDQAGGLGPFARARCQ